MNCPQCNQELNFSEEVLKKFTNCPFCGKPLTQTEESQDLNTSIGTELKRIVNEFGGFEIFSDENSSRFAKALATIDVKFSDERDKLLVANIRRIPQKMYTVIDQPQNEQKKVIDSCSDDLIKFGLQKKLIDEIISWLSSEMHFSVALEQMPIVEMENGIAVSKTELRQDRSVDMNETSAAEISQDGPIDDQDIRHWKDDKFFKNVYSLEKFKNADLESKAEMRSAAKEEAKMIKALRRDAGLGGGCYITTAICEASGKSDDCYELTMMRKFRDEWLAKQPDGYYLINDYYETAPKIVAAIDGLRERSSIYDYLNCNFLKKCVDFAGRNLMADCKKCYMDMVQYCHKFLNE